MANPTPAITFRAKLTPFMNEIVGAGQGRREVGIVAVDTANQGNRKNLVSTYLPTFHGIPNYELKDGDEFTEYGQKAVYLRSTYGVGYAPAERAYLEVVSVE